MLLLPTTYHDYTKVNEFLPVDTLFPVAKACYALEVSSRPKVTIAPGKPPRVNLDLTDGVTVARLCAFGEVWMWEDLEVGARVYLECGLDLWNGEVQIKSPTRIRTAEVGCVVPVYRGKRGKGKQSESITPEFVYTKTREALQDHLDATAGYILSHFTGMDQEYLIRRAGLNCQSLQEMLLGIHAPKTLEQGLEGIARARALAAFEVVFKAEQQTAKKPNPKSVIKIKDGDIARLVALFKHPLTEHQAAGIADIVKDLRQPYSMNRLLSGDVGFGKTEVALIPAIAAQSAGAKVVIMCPSLIIVDQWVEKVRAYGAGIPVRIVAGKHKLAQEDLAENPILIGTTALVTRLEKVGLVPDFVIFDEQQKHGTAQKEKLVGPNTNKLDATATCQPKTGALVYYGGMDETILNQCPVVKKIASRIVPPEEKGRLFGDIKRLVETNPEAQVAIVYPNVSAGDAKGSLLAAAGNWERHFPGQVGILHGGMKDDEKQAAMQKMHSQELKVLLSSVLVETGITLPSLRCMAVVGADRFGVSTLHQLRGRLARHGGLGHFYMLLPDKEVADDAMARLKLVEEIHDGFLLAEKDAELRGYGSLSEDDDRQSGASHSSMFFGMRLMPKDIERALESGNLREKNGSLLP